MANYKSQIWRVNVREQTLKLEVELGKRRSGLILGSV